MNQEYLKKIARFGDEYRQLFLFSKYQADAVATDWWQAILFFFGRAYYQGRKEIVSMKVHEAAVGVLNRTFANGNRDAVYEEMKSDNWRKLTNELELVIGKGKVGKPDDIKMTTETLRYVGSLPSKNIVAFSVAEIRAGRLREHYNNLQASKSDNGIHSVGSKIASFYLRDVVSLFALESFVSSEDLVLLQPIDTWVRKVSVKIGLVGNQNEDENLIRQRIVEACNLAQLSSLKFNQGAWFMGYHSFEIVLRNLEVIN
jgi:hypothetical protein